MNNPTRQFEMKIELPASRDQVWKAITDPAEVCRWFPREASVDARVGGEIIWSWGEQHSWRHKIEVLEPGQHLRTSYASGVPDGQGGSVPLFVDFDLQGEGGRTTLRVVHSGFGPDSAFDQEYDGISSGWQAELRSLKLYLQHHFGKDRQVAGCVAPAPGEIATSWSRLTGPRGLHSEVPLTSLKEGDHFAVTTPGGDRLEGDVLSRTGYEFAGIVRTHGNAFLRICIESCSGSEPSVWLWFATYDQPAELTGKVQKDFDTMIEQIFTPQKDAAQTGKV